MFTSLGFHSCMLVITAWHNNKSHLCEPAESRGIIPAERDELGSFLHQGSGHIGHTSGHRRLADPYGVSHRCLEWARCVEAQSSQHLDLGTDGSGPLGPSTERLTQRNTPIFRQTHVKEQLLDDLKLRIRLTSLSNSTRYRMKSLGKPNCVRRKLSETESRSKRSRVLWPRPCNSRSQSKMAIGIAMLRAIIHLHSLQAFLSDSYSGVFSDCKQTHSFPQIPQ